MFRLPLRLALLLSVLCPVGLHAQDSGSHLFILSGQSNMTGTLGDSFRNCVEQVLGKDKVLVVRVGHPGQPIKKWVRDWAPPEGMKDDKPEGNGELYDRLMQAVKRAIQDKQIQTVTLIWMQGEQDAGSRWAAVYEQSFLKLLQQLNRDLGRQQSNFVVGRINDFWLCQPDGKAIREILVRLGDEHANGAWINTDDLNRGVNPWGGFSFEDGHFPPAGYVVMGQRFAKEALRLLDPKLELDPAVFKEHFIDSHQQIKSHAAKGAAVSCTQPLPKNSSGPDDSILTDGKFGRADHQDKAWLAIMPSDAPVEVIVDLGEAMPVAELGVNMLLSSEAKAEFKGRFVFSTSEDGVEFTVNNPRYNTVKVYNAKEFAAVRAKGIEPQSVLLLTQQNDRNGPVTARKVKVTIETGDQPVFIDEIVVNPVR